MKPDDFRRIALGMEGAVEGAHMGHPDFRVNGRIFATLAPGNKQGMVKLSPDEQQRFIDNDPSTFTPASGAWGRQGCTMVRLESADEEMIGEAMTLAWRDAVSKPPSRTVKPKAAKKRRRPS